MESCKRVLEFWNIVPSASINYATFLLYLLLLSTWFPRGIDAIEITDFIATNVLPDGELETRIHFKGVTAKETAVVKGFNKGLKYRELTDGKHFIQLIYDSSSVMRDCEYLRDKYEVDKFLKTFKAELRELIDTRNITITSLDDEDNLINPVDHGWFHYETLRDLCRRRHRELKLALRMERNGRNSSLIENESFRACLKMVGTSDSNVVGKIFFNMVQTKCFVIKKKHVCRQRDWWDKKCVKKKTIKQAVLRQNPRYK